MDTTLVNRPGHPDQLDGAGNNIRRSRWRRYLAVLAPLLVLAAAVGAPAGAATDPAILTETQDLRTYYPNIEMVRDGYYLEGANAALNGQRSVLWFDLGRRGWFDQFNWGPEDNNSRCHFDRLRWRNSGLEYRMTRDSCGDVETEMSYVPSIRLMPREWTPGDEWRISGESDARFREDGDTVCRGTTTWTAEVLGWELLDANNGDYAIHLRSTQSTTWTSGRSSFGCAEGFETNWQEDYWLMPGLPIWGSADQTANSFKRSAGGNQDVDAGRWDVWFDGWQRLPR